MVEAKKMLQQQGKDRVLYSVQAVLEALHAEFYKDFKMPLSTTTPAQLPSTVMTVLGALRRSTLQGCKIVFSGVFPQNIDPRRAVPWRLAERFGATCGIHVTEDTTHVVAARWGSRKVNDALKLGKAVVVHKDWLWRSVSHFERAPEALYEMHARFVAKTPGTEVAFRSTPPKVAALLQGLRGDVTYSAHQLNGPPPPAATVLGVGHTADTNSEVVAEDDFEALLMAELF
jgi:hypothetical protein